MIIRKTPSTDEKLTTPSIVHTLLSGTIRYGKSETCVSIVVPRMKQPNHPSFWIVDPPGSMAKKIAAHAVFAGKVEADKLMIDPIAETANVPGYGFWEGSTNPDQEQ